MVMEVVHEDMGDGSLQCTNHPYRNSSPGGICGLCLQEKLGKLVSSSFPIAIFPSSTSSSSPSSSFRSDLGTAISTTSQNDYSYTKKPSKLSFVLTHKKKNKSDAVSSTAPSLDSTSIAFKRSKSTRTPRGGMHFFDENYASDDNNNHDDFNPSRRGFWSFLYLSKHSNGKKIQSSTAASSTVGSVSSSMVNNNGGVRLRDSLKRDNFVVVEENGSSPSEASVDRKVSRSRSVGCGSRSFSGDFFERISTGLGDCTLRRVESQREGKHKVYKNGQDSIKERVKCGGIFSGLMINSSSSSSYWDSNVNGRRISAVHSSTMGHVAHGRSKSWAWALASPMRAFSKPSSTLGKTETNSGKKVTPKLDAVPSLLAVSG